MAAYGRSPRNARAGSGTRRQARRNPRTNQGANSRRAAGPSDSGRRPAPHGRPSENTTLLVGAAAAGILMLVFGILLLSGPSSGRASDMHQRATVSGRISPEEARRLKQEGLEEMGRGRSYLARAGMPGTPGEQGNLATARDHLDRAQQCLSRALEGLPRDAELARLAESCGRMLYTAQKRLVVDVR